MNSNRELPNVVGMEKELLSAMMFKNGIAITKIQGLVSEEDFYRPENRIIFHALMELYHEGLPANLVMLDEKLRQQDKLKDTSIRYLSMLNTWARTAAYIENYAEEIREKSGMRQIISIAQELIDLAYENKLPLNDLLEVAEQKLLAVNNMNNKRNFDTLSNILRNSLEKINHIHNNPGALRGVPTGLADLEKVLNGLHKSDLILLAARPSMGKTALALNIAVNAAKQKNVVALFSLEMSREQIGNRLLSSESHVNSLHLNTGNLSSDDMTDLINALETMSKLDIFIDDTAGISVADLRAKTRRLRHEAGKLDLIVLDYLQLMQGRSTKNLEMNRQQEISEISRSLKALARELDVPILALSQLSRNVEMRAEKKPQLSDLRESGSLEQDADIVLFLYRDEYYNRDDTENENVAELIIAKNRNGPTTSIRLQFQKEILLFRNLEREQY